MILLDTHILLWWTLKNDRLSSESSNQLDELSLLKKLSASMISIWEIEMLDRKKKITLKVSFKDWIKEVVRADLIRIIPLDVEVILNQRNLPDDFHKDPADRVIASTSNLLELPLYTEDRKIIQSQACKIWQAE